MMIDLKQIFLKMKWVNGKPDNTDRGITLYQILNLPYEQRQYLTWVDDFHPTTKNYITSKFSPELDRDYTVTETITTACDNIGHIHFFFYDNLGIAYECLLSIEDEEYFNQIRISYFKALAQI